MTPELREGDAWLAGLRGDPVAPRTLATLDVRTSRVPLAGRGAKWRRFFVGVLWLSAAGSDSHVLSVSDGDRAAGSIVEGMPARADYEGSLASVYDRGRNLLPEAIESWRHAVCEHVAGPVDRVLDLGAGTGRFSGLLADWLEASTVAALEPAAAMRRAAARQGRVAGVAMVGAAAEQLPLRDRCVDVAWLSNVVHHFDDLDAAASELARVVVDEGRILIRGYFPDRSEPVVWSRWFPGAQMVADRFPTLELVARAFARSGLEIIAVDRVQYSAAESLADSRRRAELRADTTLACLSEEEFGDGLAAMDHDLVAEPEATWPAESLELVVLARTPMD